MKNKDFDERENFIIGPIFESVIVGQCKEMKKILGCENSYIREFLSSIAQKHFL